MGLFNFLKTNKQKTLKSNDVLADIVEKAIKDTSLRPLFYKTLLSSELIVLTNETKEPYGESVLQEDTKIKIVTFEDGTIPIFSSTDRIFDNGVITNEVPFIGMNGESLLKATKGGRLILNPYSNAKKELLPVEIESLLSGKMFEPQITSVKKGTKIRIGQPANLSEELVKSIKAYCKIRPEILSAYIALIHKADEELPNLLVSIDMASNEKEIFGEIGEVVKPYLKENEYIDFMPLQGGLCSYFKSIEPIYRKQSLNEQKEIVVEVETEESEEVRLQRRKEKEDPQRFMPPSQETAIINKNND